MSREETIRLKAYLCSSVFICGLFSFAVAAETPTGESILNKVDANNYSDTRVAVAQMVIHLARNTRTVRAKSWVKGSDNSFTEFLYPPRDAGTKMLKLGDDLWTYTPETDRIIKISGQMLRQSVMGSDLSYEDMMEDRKLIDEYDASVTGSDTVRGRPCWVVELTAKTPDVSYHSRMVWVDKERYVPLRENRFAKSGMLLKTTEVDSVSRRQGRWVADRITFKDALKTGAGTEFVVDSIQFNVPIPDYIFSKASLKK
ncbi:MAG TPA: outer membrane lipoprotein-sorting protein [bacterium]|nr:outer membrane lipoprotein-sorting protein [bacterium]